jgi:uncharacterized repeat protein (TIGR03803 family)
LIADAQGDLFGTTSIGGTGHAGTVFELVNTGSGYTEKVLHSFSFSEGGGQQAALIADANGDLFGTTGSGGGPANAGPVFEITDSGFVLPPRISGAVANEPAATLNPFGQVVISDLHPNQTETVTITRVENTGKSTSNALLYGVLFDPNAATDGSTNVNGVYSVRGSAAAVTADLQGLEHSPGLHTTHYTIHVIDTLGLSATDTTTSIIGVLNTSHFT